MFIRKDKIENKPTQILTLLNDIRGFNIDKDWLKNAKKQKCNLF